MPNKINILLLFLGFSVLISCKNDKPLPTVQEPIVINENNKSGSAKSDDNNSSDKNNSTNVQYSKTHSIVIQQRVFDTIFYKGERGGCYFINKNGNKTYIDKSRCSALLSQQNAKATKPDSKQQIKQEVEKSPEKIAEKSHHKKTLKVIKYHLDENDSCYYINSKDEKILVENSKCSIDKQSSKQISSEITYISGDDDTCWYVNNDGKKIFVDKSKCGINDETSNDSGNPSEKISTSKTYHVGKRGGVFYINSHGNKSYVKH